MRDWKQEIKEQPRFKRLHSGNWGVIGPKDLVTPGRTIPVTKRNGKTLEVTIANIVWSNNEIAIAAVEETQPARETQPTRETQPAPQPDKPDDGDVVKQAIEQAKSRAKAAGYTGQRDPNLPCYTDAITALKLLQDPDNISLSLDLLESSGYRLRKANQ